MILAQDADTVCDDLLVQGDGLIEAVSISVYICEAVACSKRVVVVLTQNTGAVCDDLLIQRDGIVEAAC